LQDHVGASAADRFENGPTLQAIAFADGNNSFSAQVDSQAMGNLSDRMGATPARWSDRQDICRTRQSTAL
jgi:hypothetical protein